MIFQSIKTSDLSAGMVNEIFYLKDSHWNFGFKSQKKWFLKNMKPNDLHNILKIDDKIVGYTLLAFRSYKISANSDFLSEKKYILFATFILKKKLRNFLNASKMMKFNNKIIFKHKKPSFLLCHKEKLNFYKFYGWSTLDDKAFKVLDHKHNLKAMVFNFKKFQKNKKKFYNFSYYR